MSTLTFFKLALYLVPFTFPHIICITLLNLSCTLFSLWDQMKSYITGTPWALTDVLWQIFCSGLSSYCSRLFSWPFPGIGRISAALVENTDVFAFRDDKSGPKLPSQTLGWNGWHTGTSPAAHLQEELLHGQAAALSRCNSSMERSLQVLGGIFIASSFCFFFHRRAQEIWVFSSSGEHHNWNPSLLQLLLNIQILGQCQLLRWSCSVGSWSHPMQWYRGT